MDIFDNYFKLLNEIYEYFGFVEDYVVLPLDDRREYDWEIINDSEVKFGKREDILNDTGNYYEDEIYKQRFYNKWVYRGEEFTMIMVDTHTDGNRFMAIFDNSKEIKSA